MLKHYIILFVLVISMVKTNAQVSTYYCKDKKIELKESDNLILIRLQNDGNLQNKIQLLQKAKTDDNCILTECGHDGYYMLSLKKGRNINKREAINNYINESYVASANCFFYDTANNIYGVSNNIVVKLKNGITETQLKQIVANYGYLTIEQYKYDHNIYIIKLSKKSSSNILQISSALFESGNFEYAEPNFFHFAKADACTPLAPSPWTINDPFFNYQWNLYNCGSGPYGGTANADINLFDAWNIIKEFTPTGSGSGSLAPSDLYNIKVAVLDAGVDLTHPDLNVGTGFDETPYLSTSSGGSYTPTYDDFYPDNAHGTCVAGIIGAKLNNHLGLTYYGVTGIAPGVTIIPCRIGYFYEDTNPGSPFFGLTVWSMDDLTLSSGLYSVVDNANVDIINMSFHLGSGTPPSTIETAIAHAVTSGRGGLGCVIVCAASNNGASTIPYPAANPSTIAVGASNMCDGRVQVTASYGSTYCDNASFSSNYGVATTTLGGNMLSVVAPGVNIYTTDIQGAYGYNTVTSGAGGDYFSDFGGTSASAPHVAGVAALMLYANPCLRYDEVKSIIEKTAKKVTGLAPPYSYTYSSGYPSGTWNAEVGYGRLDAGKAVYIAHDMYKQNITETSTKIYEASHQIFAGYNVTSLIPTGYYDVQSGAKISFFAAKAINLKAGFFAEHNSVFLAKIINSCHSGSTYSHYRLTNSNGDEGNVIISSDEPDIRIYPNPAQDILNVSLSLTQQEQVSFTICNVLGQQLSVANTVNMEEGNQLQKLSISNLIPGVYLLTVKTKNFQKQFKFIKE